LGFISDDQETERNTAMKQPIPIFEAHVVDKRLKMLEHVKKSVSLWVRTFPDGTKLDIVIKKQKAQRTNEQNKYYWGVVIPILADYFGYESDEMHMVLRGKFLRIHDEKHPDFVIAKSTTKLSTTDFVEYIEVIQRWAAAEHGIYIPPPLKAEED
jgi:hypothetical protein